MKLLTREDLDAINDLKFEDVPVPEWGDGVGVRVRMLTASERDAYEASSIDKEGNFTQVDLRARLLSRCLVDESGNRLYSDLDMKVLGAKSAKACERLFNVATRLNAMTQADLDELEKASGVDQANAGNSN